MYNAFKTIGKHILSKSFIRKNEGFFRKILSLKYRGNRYTCNVCLINLRTFITLGKNDYLCPNCGSRNRTRRLYSILNEEITLKGKVLHFSPSRGIYELLKRNTDITYYPTDFENEFLADFQFDILNIDIPDNHFDIIICYHILEHIENDKLAMQELKRVLKPSGICLVQTPFKEGNIYEDSSKKSEEDRLEAFGQKDHVRIYSIEGLKERLNQAGFIVDILNYKLDKDDKYLRGEGITLIAKISEGR